VPGSHLFCDKSRPENRRIIGEGRDRVSQARVMWHVHGK
jgi:hypothetical protein